MTTIQLKRGDAGLWTSVNPVLKDGEPGFEDDTGRLKIGDGTTDWISLPYQGGGGGPTQTLNVTSDPTVTAAENELTYAVADAGGVVVSLPPTPADGTTNTIVAATVPIVLDGNGNNIYYGATDGATSAAEYQRGTVITVRWDASDDVWLVTTTSVVTGRMDLGMVTLVAQNSTQDENYAITNIMPGWIPDQGIGVSQVGPDASDWIPLQTVASGDLIQVIFSESLADGIWDSVDFGYELVVWDLTGANLIAVGGGGFTPGDGGATPGPQPLAPNQLIGTALSITEDGLSVTTSVDGVYNIMLKSGAGWD